MSFVKVSTDEGVTGWSEYYENYWSRGLTDVIRKLAASSLGEDPREVGRLSTKLSTMTRITEGGLNAQAIAAIENACLDIKAKALGIPVYALFGGPYRRTLPLYWSHCGSFRARAPKLFEQVIGTPPLRTLDDIRALGKHVVERGYRALKTNPMVFDKGTVTMLDAGFSPNPTEFAHNPDRRARRAIVELMEAFRDGAGPDTGLLIDLNFSLRTEGLLRVAQDLEHLDLTWLEMDSYDAKALSLVRASTRTPIGSCEALHGRRAYRPFLEQYAMDVAIVDAPWNGLLESVKIAAMAEAYQVNVAPHNFCGHLYTMINAHLGAAIPNFRILEIEVDDVPWKDELVTVAPVVENGSLLLSDAPGWGTEVNEEAVRAHPPQQPGWQ
nr:mandelate racemase/muconate lactonizing enzyme family protein [Ramlibacter aurantiacus]